MASPSVLPAVGDWTLLFNDPRYHALHLAPGDRPLHLLGEHDGRVAGSLSGVLDADGTFTSGHHAPFGGPDLARPRETPLAVDALLDDLLAQLDAHEPERVVLRLKPPSYSENEALLLHGLLRRGFAVADCDLSFAVDLRGVRRLDDHLERLRSSARRAVRQLAADDLRFAALEPGDDAGWAAAWTVIEANRAAKGYALALDRDDVRAMRDAFGDRIRMAVLEHAGAPCAAALVYRVAPRRDLLVAWGDAHHHLPRSPMPLLAARVVGQVLATGGELLDLGPATLPVDGRPANPGLVEFKRGVGGVAEPRMTLVKDQAWTTR